MELFNASRLSTEDKLKFSLYQHSSQVLDDVGSSNTLFGKVEFSKDAKLILSELFWNKLQSFGSDLEAFSQHAKRSIINIEDLKLLFRNNLKLLEKISDIDDGVKGEANKAKTGKAGKKRKRSMEDEEPDQECVDLT